MYIKTQYDKTDITKKVITLDGNETITENINRIINHIQTHKVLATKAKRYFGMKHLKELNDILVRPLEIISARPVQKSYPNLNGLYLLLRTMGILRFKVSKKEVVVGINEELLKNWQQLNATEQYFMLLEFWLFHSRPDEIIEGFHKSPLTALMNFFQRERFSLDKTLSELDYNPEYSNLALCEMFGFVDIYDLTPKDKNRWNIIDIKVKPLAKKILPLAFGKDEKERMHLLFSELKLGAFQQIFQPYFKEFNAILAYPKEKNMTKGVYQLKVSLGRIYRTIEVDADTTCERLALTVLEQFTFDCDHLYEFRFTDDFGKNRSIKHPEMREEADDDLWADAYCLKNLPLQVSENFKFIFDFGDWWEFDILIEKIDESREIKGVKLIKSQGEAPKQYPDYDEEWEG